MRKSSFDKQPSKLTASTHADLCLVHCRLAKLVKSTTEGPQHMGRERERIQRGSCMVGGGMSDFSFIPTPRRPELHHPSPGHPLRKKKDGYDVSPTIHEAGGRELWSAQLPWQEAPRYPGAGAGVGDVDGHYSSPLAEHAEPQPIVTEPHCGVSIEYGKRSESDQRVGIVMWPFRLVQCP